MCLLDHLDVILTNAGLICPLTNNGVTLLVPRRSISLFHPVRNERTVQAHVNRTVAVTAQCSVAVTKCDWHLRWQHGRWRVLIAGSSRARVIGADRAKIEAALAWTEQR